MYTYVYTYIRKVLCSWKSEDFHLQTLIWPMTHRLTYIWKFSTPQNIIQKSLYVTAKEPLRRDIRLYRALLRKYTALSQWYVALLQWYTAFLQWYRALLQWYRALLQWRRAILRYGAHQLTIQKEYAADYLRNSRALYCCNRALYCCNRAHETRYKALLRRYTALLQYAADYLRNFTCKRSSAHDTSFAEYSLFYRALLQKRPMILRSLLIVATPYLRNSTCKRSSAHDTSANTDLNVAVLPVTMVCIHTYIYI